MLLPQGGRVLILDDKIEQALPLMQVLSKHKAPFSFHTGDQAELPENPYDDIRLVFLDIDLTEGVDDMAVKAQLIAVLKRLIRNETPYILAVWSTKETKYDELLTNLFINELSFIKPIVRLSLMKRDFFRTNGVTGVLELDPGVDTLAELNNRLHQATNSVDTVKLFIEWENIVSKSTSETVLNFTSLVNKDKYWNNNMKHLLLKLAYAQLGRNLKKANESTIIQSALKIVTSHLADKIESSVENLNTDINKVRIKKEGLHHLMDVNGKLVKLDWENLKTNVLTIDGIEKNRNPVVDNLKGSNSDENDIIEKFKEMYRTASPRLNAELLLSKNSSKELKPGNVYYKKVTGSRKRKLLATYFKDIRKKKDKNFEIRDLSSFWFIELECTPTCDFSQDKWLRSRILSGILYPASYHNKIDKNIDSFYREIPSFQFNKSVVRLVFDYRLFKSINLENDKRNSSDLIFKLKNEVLSDIQTRISSHVSRLGITTIS